MDADSSSSVTDSDDNETPTINSKKLNFSSCLDNNFSKKSAASGAKNSEMNEENIVVYRLFPLTSNGATLETLATLQAFAFNLSKDFIWHNEPFRLFAAETPKSHFVGRTDFGDNMEDEWFIVYILYEISKNFPDFVISVVDSDGQFLLIEAADYVPSWLNGEVADNRVFIFRGALHIVPLTKHLNPCPRSFADSSIDRLLADGPGRLFAILQEESLFDRSLANENIQRTILKRIDNYLERIKSQRHRFNCVLPAKLAMVLNETGSFFTSAAMNSIFQNDAKVNKESSTIFPVTDFITTSVVLSKHQYAKLSYSKNVPNGMLPKKAELGWKANEFGMKLTKGFEILCNKAIVQPKANENGNTTTNYFDVLQILGYFEGANEGSKEYDRLMRFAKLNYVIQAVGESGQSYSALLASELLSMVKKLDAIDLDALRKECQPQQEDDDRWLELTPDKLEKMLSEKMTNVSPTKSTKTKNSSKSGVSVSTHLNGSATTNGDHASAPSVIPKNLGQNFKMQSNQKLVEVVNENASKQPPKGVDFNSDMFTDSVKRMLDLHIPQDGSDSSDMESYGDEVLDLSLDEKDSTTVDSFASDMKQYMNFMDSEAKSKARGGKHAKNHVKSAKGKSSKMAAKAASNSANSPSGDSIDFEDDDFTPVDIDKKLVSNMLESFFPEACGQSGSSSTLLHGERATALRKSRESKEGGKRSDH